MVKHSETKHRKAKLSLSVSLILLAILFSVSGLFILGWIWVQDVPESNSHEWWTLLDMIRKSKDSWTEFEKSLIIYSFIGLTSLVAAGLVATLNLLFKKGWLSKIIRIIVFILIAIGIAFLIWGATIYLIENNKYIVNPDDTGQKVYDLNQWAQIGLFSSLIVPSTAALTVSGVNVFLK